MSESHVAAVDTRETDIIIAYLNLNQIAVADIPTLVSTVRTALASTPAKTARASRSEGQGEPQDPAVPVKRSVTPDALFCLECGKPVKTLRRHLQAEHGLTPDEYRTKWNLRGDYPMTAPNYAQFRSELAKEAGLGKRKAAEAVAEAA